MSVRPEYIRIVGTGAGERLWQLYGFSSPEDLVLENIAMAMNVYVREGDLDSAEARLVANHNEGVILVRASSGESGRRRFAIAHELGHWVMHKGVSQLIFACSEGDMLVDYRGSQAEAEANYFAAGLLMPERLAKGFIVQLYCRDAIAEMADYFRVSFTAAATRFMDLTGEYCALVVASGGKIIRWRGNDRFCERFWVKVGDPVGGQSIAAKLSSQRRVGRGDVPTHLWAVDRDVDGGIAEFCEESIYVERYDQTLVLLSAFE